MAASRTHSFAAPRAPWPCAIMHDPLALPPLRQTETGFLATSTCDEMIP
jgi:hypothetical protein